jgi:Protein of unknown function (DUF2797)
MGTVDSEEGAVPVTERESGSDSLALGVSWTRREPYLDLLDAHPGDSRRSPLAGRRLGLRLTSPGPYCLGYSGAVDGVLTGVPCPRGALATSGQQCEECLARDEFRFAHHAHLGGYVPDALAGYLAQPHWVYIATFADATSKVGTAADRRRVARLDEQGAACATYVARLHDGRLARTVEDAITERTGIVQTKRRAAKVAALERPAVAAAIRAEHRDAVEQAREVVAAASAGSTGRPVSPGSSDSAWERPATAEPFFADVPTGGWLPYPHGLAAGEHGFHVDAVAGSVLLARLRDDEDAARYVVDLGAVTGRRLVLGPYASPNTPEQLSLF